MELNFKPLRSYKPNYGNMMINDHDLHHLPEVSDDDVKLFPKTNSDLSDFELCGGSTSNFTTVLTPSSLFPPNPANDFPCTGFPLMQRTDAIEAMREAIFRAAVMQPVVMDTDSMSPPPERKNVKISKEPHSVAARLRREKISHRMRVLQRMVPGGTKLDTASMLDEAAHYVKFLKKEIELLEQVSAENYRQGDGFCTDGAN